jgi:hypothetical protein
MRRFTEHDQERFARFSGDWNPMHMDPIAARRTQAGAPVVQGVHLALWTLDTLIRDGVVKGEIASVQAVWGSGHVPPCSANAGRSARRGRRADLASVWDALPRAALGFRLAGGRGCPRPPTPRRGLSVDDGKCAHPHGSHGDRWLRHRRRRHPFRAAGGCGATVNGRNRPAGGGWQLRRNTR